MIPNVPISSPTQEFRYHGWTKFDILAFSLYLPENLNVLLHMPKKSCYRTLNAIFGKVGRSASAEVVLELVAKKCWPILLYGLEACPVTTSDTQSLDFLATRFLMKLFDTSNMDIINDCICYFGFSLPSILLKLRTDRFFVKLRQSNQH